MNFTIGDWLDHLMVLGLEATWEEFPIEEGNLRIETGLFLNGVEVGRVHQRRPKWSFDATFGDIDPSECLDAETQDQAVAYIKERFQEWLEEADSPMLAKFSQSFKITCRDDSGYGSLTVRADGLELGTLYSPDRKYFGYEYFGNSGSAHSLEDAQLCLLENTYRYFFKMFEKRIKK
jgi:hypothetical protein